MIKLDGYTNSSATFIKSGEIANGSVVAITDNLTVSATETETPVFGVCISSDDNYALVQTKGYIEVPYTVAPTVGFGKIVGTADGIKTSETGTPCFIVSVDTTAEKCGIIL